MATYVNVIDCTTDVSNTGVTNCSYDAANFEGNILLPKGKTFTKSEVAAISATITALITNDNKALRAYPIQRFEGCELKNTESTYRESGYGVSSKTRQGKYGFVFEYRDGAIGLHKQLSSFDGKQGEFDIMFMDAKNNGLAGMSKDGVTFKGFTLDRIDVPNVMFNNGTDPTLYHIDFGLAYPEEVNKYMSFVPMPDDVDVMDFVGLTNINMVVDTELAAVTAGTLNLKFMAGGIDLYDNYSGAIDTASLYTFTNAQTGAAITVTSVTAVPATKSFAVLLDVLDADYPAVGGRVKAYFGDVSDIATAGMVRFGEAIAYSTRIA